MAFETFQEVAADRWGYLTHLKHSGKRIIGCMPMYVPEEIFHAAGLVPVVLLQGEDRIAAADAWIQSFFCEWGRSIVEDVLSGRFDCLDGMANADTCHTVRGVSQIVKKHSNLAYYESFFMPAGLNNPRSRSYLLSELQSLKGRVEAFAGRKITDDDLAGSVEVYGRTRHLLGRLYELKRARPGAVSLQQGQEIVVAAMTMPKEEFNDRLAGLLPKLEAAPVAKTGKAKLFLSGSMCDALDAPLIELIDGLGAVVDDDLYVGSRYLSAGTNGGQSPLDIMADQYLNMTPCPTRQNKTNWADHLVQQAKASGAQAVISILPKFCEPHAIYLPKIEGTLSQAGIPHYAIETVAESGLPGQVKTRLEAFIETVQSEEV